MVNRSGNFAAIVAAWAEQEPSVHALVLIGSRVRTNDDGVWRADAQSDWDFQIVTSRPELFCDAVWTRGLAGTEVRAYAMREARLGDVPKVSAVFAGAEADFVILPAGRLEQLRLSVERGQPLSTADVHLELQALAIVIRPGWRFLKGEAEWEPLYQWIVAEVADARLDNGAACRLAEGFVCDYIWARRKLERGELIAVQRMLHRELAEVTFRLLHELKLRRGERTFPDGRRLERVATPAELAGVSISAPLAGQEMQAALEKCAATLRNLMGALVKNAWHWPDV